MYTKKTTFKASDTRQVGEIIDDKVKRGSDDEAVVGIKIQPIHSLVKLRYLHLALQQALEVYVEEQRDTTCKWLYSYVHVGLFTTLLTKLKASHQKALQLFLLYQFYAWARKYHCIPILQ